MSRQSEPPARGGLLKRTAMSRRELERVEVMGRVAKQDLRLSDAAALLELSYRQTKRVWRRYRDVGSEGLKKGNAGRPANRGKPGKVRRRVLHLLQKKDSGSEEGRLGPALAAEHLDEEDGLVIDHETLRRWMVEAGLWSRQRKRKQHCQRRERKRHFGELAQLDGSFHDWFEGRGPRGCVMDMVDDASSDTQARIGKEETIWAAAGVLRVWIETYGVPRALHRLEERVQAENHARPAVAGRGAGDAIWAHVPEAEDSHYRGPYAAGQGTSGTPTRSPSGPADQEAAAKRDCQLRSRESVSGAGVSACAQPALRPCGGRTGGPSSPKAQRPRTAPDFPVGNGTRHRQRLGDPARRAQPATAPGPTPRWTAPQQSFGVRMGRWKHGGALPGGEDRLNRTARATPEIPGADCTRRARDGGKETETQPPLAAALPEPAATGSRHPAPWPAHFPLPPTSE